MEAASGNVTLERLGPDGDGERSTWSFHLPPGAAVELGRMPLPQEMQEVFLHLTLSNGTSLGRYFPAWHAEKISVTLEPDQVWVGLSST